MGVRKSNIDIIKHKYISMNMKLNQNPNDIRD